MRVYSSLLLIAIGTAANAEVIYSNLPQTLAPNYASLGYEATSTSEFGKEIAFAGSARELTSATITMSDWARASDFPGYTPGDSNGFYHDITLNIYAVGTNGVPGALLGSKTQNQYIPYRPDGAGPYTATDGNQYNGVAFNLNFDLSSLNLTVPDQIIYGVAYNTGDYGANPLHANGPYNSLNYACDDVPTLVGSDLSMDTAYLNSKWAGNYTDAGAGGLGIFREDTKWTGYRPMAQFEAVPEPTSLAAFALGGVVLLRRRKKA